MGFESGLLALGADPEVFLYTKDGKPRSAEGLLGGTKQNPKPFGDVEGFAIQEDNVAAEFNIPPARTPHEFNAYIAKALRYVQTAVKAHKLDVKCVAAAHFSIEELLTPHAQRLGCDPDFNAWTRTANPSPRPPKTLRTAAGHLHLSWEKPHITEQELMVRYLDLFLGVPSVLATSKNERRTLYGKAGCFRPKDYGVEYRTLDNFWVSHGQDRMHIFNVAHDAARKLYQNRGEWTETLDEFSEEIQAAINDHDYDLALHLVHAFNLPLFDHV